MSQALSEPLPGHWHRRSRPSLEEVAGAYVAAGPTPAARKCRRIGVVRFIDVFGDLTGWASASTAARRAVRTEVMSFAAHAIVRCQLPVALDFVVASRCRWGIYIRDAYPAQATEFDEQAASLGFCGTESRRMWTYLAKICILTGTAPTELSAAQYQQARTALHDAIVEARGYRPKSLSTPLFGLDAVMFHRGQGPAPDIRRRWTGRPAPEVDWQDLATRGPQLVATMRRYLDQCALSLRPSSVHLFDTTLRQFAAHLLACDPPVTSVAGVAREHIESFKTELATRPGYRGKLLPKRTLGMRLGHLHTFFARIIEWDYEDVPARIPVYSTDRPRLDKPLPKFLDDAQAAAFMIAARQLPDPLDRLMVTVLVRTGMRRGELLGLTVDAVVQIGTGYWLRTRSASYTPTATSHCTPSSRTCSMSGSPPVPAGRPATYY